MNSWEERWQSNKQSLTLDRARTSDAPARGPGGIKTKQSPALSRFHGQDPSVHYVSPQPIVVPQSDGGGGSFSNAVMLVLSGFAVGTLWGESLLTKMLGGSHKHE